MDFNFSDIKYITEVVHNNLLKRSQLKENDLLMTITGRIGTCAVANKECLPGNINQHIVRIRLKQGYNPYFVAAFLNSDMGLLLSNRGVTGTTRIALDYESIKKIPIPNITDQSKQLYFISKIDVALKKKNRKLVQADELLLNQSNILLKHLNLTIDNYTSSLCSAVVLRNLSLDKTFSAEYYHPERINAINSMKDNSLFRSVKLNNVVDFCRNIVKSDKSTDCYLGLSGVESQTGELTGIEEETSGQAFTYHTNDILYGRLRPYLNKVLFAEQGGICSTEFHVMRVKNTQEILPEYLAEIMRSDLILCQTKHMMTGNTHPRISNDDVKNLYIPVPEISLQEHIVNEIRSRRQEARKLKQEAEQEWQAAKKQFEKELLGE